MIKTFHENLLDVSMAGPWIGDFYVSVDDGEKRHLGDKIIGSGSIINQELASVAYCSFSSEVIEGVLNMYSIIHVFDVQKDIVHTVDKKFPHGIDFKFMNEKTVWYEYQGLVTGTYQTISACEDFIVRTERGTVNSAIVGNLIQDERLDDYWENEGLEIPFFNHKKLKIVYEFEPKKDAGFIKEADEALSNFLTMKIDDRNNLSELAHKNCMDFLNEIGQDEQDAHLWKIEDKNDIWQYIYPTEIYLKRRFYNDKDIYLSIACECDWEQEHGLQFVFRQGKKLTRISEQDGHLTEADAYGKSDTEDELLTNFLIPIK